MKKNKKLISIISLVGGIIIGIILGIIITNIIDKPSESKELEQNKETVEKVEYKESITISLEDDLPSIKDYLVVGEVQADDIVYKNDNDEEVDLTKNVIGTYSVYINNEKISTLIILDEVKPELELKELTIEESKKYVISDFVVSCSDNSNEECLLSFKDDEMSSYNKAGTYGIVILAKDSSDNVTLKSTKLIINKKKEVNNNKPSNSGSQNTGNNNSKPVNNNNTNNNSSNNNNNSGNNSNNKPAPTLPKEEVSYKYGTKITKITYANGKVSYTYDFSTFNGKTSDMKSEASVLVSTNANNYNEVLKYTNVYRNEVGVASLTLDNNLSLAATIRAIEMAYADKFDHTRPNNSSCFTIFNELGISGYYTYGENIAYAYNYGYYSPELVTKGWRESPGHYANMINSSFTKLGVGYYKLGTKEYYVQLFGG